MGDGKGKAAATEEAATPEKTEISVTGIKTKEELYDKLHAYVMANSRCTSDAKKVVMAKGHGRELFVLALKGIFEIVCTQGKIALPAGHGSIQLVGRAPRTVTTPQGTKVDAPARWAVRYQPGTNVESRVKALPPPKVTEAEPEAD